MHRSMQKNCVRLILGVVILGSCGIAWADQQATESAHYRQEVRNRLKTLQTSLDVMFANHQLTADQYQAESERVRQLRVQMHADAQEDGSVTQEDRDTDFSLIQQINQEASQWAVANSSGGTASQNTPLSDLQMQYAGLNNQYQNLDTRYSTAISAKDPQTAQALRAQMDALKLQMDDVRTKMQQLIGPATNP